MQERFYRKWVRAGDLVGFETRVKETDLFIRADKNLEKEAYKSVKKYRAILEEYIKKDSLFLKSLKPLDIDPQAPLLIRKMAESALLADVGPMASVAGAIAEFVGQELLKFTKEIIIENGGDIFLRTEKERVVGVYAGDSPLSGKIGIQIGPSVFPLGICTSSGKVGPSLSFGSADAVTVLARSAILADAFATAVANKVKTTSDIENLLNFYSRNEEIIGLIIILGDKIGYSGRINLLRL